MKNKISALNWQKITEEMNEKGFSVVNNLLTNEECEKLKSSYNEEELYRKTVIMENHGFGLGEYKYFNYPLPNIIQNLRENVYPYLVPVANNWMELLKNDTRFPKTFQELQSLCHSNNQLKATALILEYNKGGYNTLHQDLYGEIYFPIQIVLFLDQVDEDYTGGEFVLTQQKIRGQSKAIVLKPKKGEMLIFTTNFRPSKGIKGYQKLNMKHGVSEIQSGKRHTLGIIFHDAVS